jgi:hypothetical protein
MHVKEAEMMSGRHIAGVVALVFVTAACDSARSPSAPSATVAAVPVASSPLPPEAPSPGPLGPSFLRPPSQAPVSATDPIVGRYRMDLAIGADCAPVGAGERNRTYTADIVEDHGAGYDYVVNLYDATFLVAMGCHDPRFPSAPDICNQFRAARSDGSLNFDFMAGPDDNWNGNKLYEFLLDGDVLEMGGTASGAVRGGTIAATGSVGVTRWRQFMSEHSYTYCGGAGLRLTLTRR